ncbi:hypothetical protein JCM10908_001591 [Rhodotorula pacifica]|uniref:uncharacterized protein n=1 Tax=Rhodotorula pacifica TaxID=1495444 RepID=UPI00317DB931
MLTNRQSGFRAAFAVRELPSPPPTPATTTEDASSAPATSAIPQQQHQSSSADFTPVPKFLVEHAPTVLETGQIVAYVEASDEPIRVLFWRDAAIKPVEGLEAYAAFLHLPDEQPWCKVFAIGGGVLELPGLDWYIDGDLGLPAPTLAETARYCAMLKIFRCTLKPGAQLGYGYVSSADVAAVDETTPVCVFAWHFVTRRQLELLGVGASRITPHTSNPLSFRIAPAVRPETMPPNELAPALEFLRLANRLLVSLLTADQKSKFIKLLSTSQEAQQLLQVDDLRKLEGFGKSTVQPNADSSTADSSTTSETASDERSSSAISTGSKQGKRRTGEKRKGAPAAVEKDDRPRRVRTAPPKYREDSSP